MGGSQKKSKLCLRQMLEWRNIFEIECMEIDNHHREQLLNDYAGKIRLNPNNLSRFKYLNCTVFCFMFIKRFEYMLWLCCT